MNIRIKYFDDELIRLEKIEKGDWIDLRSRETISYTAGDVIKIPLGIAMELPAGYEAYVLPRSSTCKNYGVLLTNSQAVIDNSYCGDTDEWFASLYAVRDGSIQKNDRILQFRIQEKMPPITFEEVSHLGNEDRGGHGSTGIR